MKIYPVKYTDYSYNKQQARKSYSPSFGQSEDRFIHYPMQSAKKVKQGLFGKLFPISIMGLISLGGVNSCSDKNFTGMENISGVNIEYYHAGKEAKDSTLTPLFDLKSKLTKENDFLDGIEVSISDKYSNLSGNNSFSEHLKLENNTKTKGANFYSDGNLPRRIAIQENAHMANKIWNYFKNNDYTAIPALRQTLMHEVGHQFDSYFGHNHNADFAKAWDSILLAAEKKTKKLYNLNSGLSDSKEFQAALLEDLQRISKWKAFKPNKLADNIHYYIEFFDFTKPITAHEVNLADFSRSEIYANLFSYATGQDEGNRAKFIDDFKNSFEIVKKDIKKHLNLDVDTLYKTVKHTAKIM